MDGCLEEEAHEAKFDPVLGLKGGLDLSTQCDEVGKVGFIEGGENCCGLLCADETVGNFPAKGGHLFPGFTARA